MGRNKLKCLILRVMVSLFIVASMGLYKPNKGVVVYALSNKTIVEYSCKSNKEYSNQIVQKDMLSGKISSNDMPHIWFTNRLNRLAKDYNKNIHIYSAYRSIEHQAVLYNKSDKTGKRVAPPGRSRHNIGLAVDVAGWATHLTNEQLAPYKLYKPMSYEPWHIEPIETRGKPTEQLRATYGTRGKQNDISNLVAELIDSDLKKKCENIDVGKCVDEFLDVMDHLLDNK